MLNSFDLFFSDYETSRVVFFINLLVIQQMSKLYITY